MSRERAQIFADRLPPLVPKEETDISHLSDEMADVLYPGRRPRPYRLALLFDAFEGPDYAKALALAQRSPVYREEHRQGRLVHQAAFETAQARVLRELFQVVGSRAGTEVLVDGQRVPYARELWLPLFWIFVGAES